MKRSQIKRRPMADTVLASLEPEEKEYRELDGDGLYFRVKTDGSKSWQLRYKKTDGKWSWLGLGGYGTGDHHLTGEQARRKVRELRDSTTRDGSIMATRRAKKLAELEAANNTFEHLAREWYATKRKHWTDGTAVRTIGALEKHVFPIFGRRPYIDILPMEWMDLLRGMEQTGIIEQTSRVRAMCREIYDLARVTGRATHNPLEGLQKFLLSNPAENFAHVSLEELPALLRAIRAYPHAPDVRIALQLLSMLACRPSELREASWEEFDLDTGLWVIPSKRMKRRREHIIPLSTQATGLLRQLYNLTGTYSLLFPGRGDSTKPRSNTAFLMALRRLGYQGRQTPHGFRHLASTILNDHDFNPEHVEVQLSHVKDGVRGVYDRSIYLEQRKVMMQWYADYLDTLAAGNVVQLKLSAL